MAFDIVDPTTGKKLKTYEMMGPGEVEAILDRCRETQLDWRLTTSAERRRLMLGVAEKLEACAAQSDWLRDIKASWKAGNGMETEHAIWSRAADAGVLLFDDFGA